jgi:uncharacterized protein YaiE (UPF0345 family)
VIKLLVVVCVAANFYTLALQGASEYMHFATGANPAQTARATNWLYVSNTNFAVGQAGAFNLNINGRTYYYVAIGI